MKIMIDTNVVLDMLQDREPHVEYSAIVLNEAFHRRITGILAGHSLTTINYLLAKYQNQHLANEKTDWLLAHFEIVSADKPLFLHARTLPINDFEDAVVAALAETAGCDYIITRNMPDFEQSPVSAITPEQFVKQYVSK